MITIPTRDKRILFVVAVLIVATITTYFIRDTTYVDSELTPRSSRPVLQPLPGEIPPVPIPQAPIATHIGTA